MDITRQDIIEYMYELGAFNHGYSAYDLCNEFHRLAQLLEEMEQQCNERK